MVSTKRLILIIIFTFYTTILVTACLNQDTMFHPDFYFQTIWFLFLILQTELYLMGSLNIKTVSLLFYYFRVILEITTSKIIFTDLLNSINKARNLLRENLHSELFIFTQWIRFPSCYLGFFIYGTVHLLLTPFYLVVLLSSVVWYLLLFILFYTNPSQTELKSKSMVKILFFYSKQSDIILEKLNMSEDIIVDGIIKRGPIKIDWS